MDSDETRPGDQLGAAPPEVSDAAGWVPFAEAVPPWSAGEPPSREPLPSGGGRRRQLRVGIGAAIVLGLLVLSAGVLFAFADGVGAQQSVGGSVAGPGVPSSASVVRDAAGATSESGEAELFVHVFGAVREPGLYRMRPGSRVVDAVAAAGGFAEDADRDRANLARILVDGEQLGVAREGDEAIPSGEGAGGGDAAGASGAASSAVSLNRASAAELQSLPQVGPATAQSIIDWRTQNGPFTTVEELMSISGIGQKTFDRLKDLVTL